MEGKPYNLVILIVTILSLLAAIYFGFTSQQASREDRKDLLINLTVKSPIITKEVISDLDFSVNGIKANDVYYNEIRLENTGGQSISREDFYDSKPIRLYFGKSCDIVSLQNITSPSSFRERLVINKLDDHVEILPTLINKGDHTKIKIVTANCNPTMLVKGSISGISQISENWTVDEPRGNITALMLTFILPIFVFACLNLLNKKYNISYALQNTVIIINLFSFRHFND